MKYAIRVEAVDTPEATSPSPCLVSAASGMVGATFIVEGDCLHDALIKAHDECLLTYQHEKIELRRNGHAKQN